MSANNFRSPDGARVVRLRGLSPDPTGTPLVRSKAGTSVDNLELADRLCAISTSLGESRLVHVRILGSLVPHVFMASVLERVRACLCADTSLERRDRRPEMEAILAVLDSVAADGDRDTRGVIALSFVRDAKKREFYADLLPLMGRRLAALAK